MPSVVFYFLVSIPVVTFRNLPVFSSVTPCRSRPYGMNSRIWNGGKCRRVTLETLAKVNAGRIVDDHAVRRSSEPLPRTPEHGFQER